MWLVVVLAATVLSSIFATPFPGRTDRNVYMEPDPMSRFARPIQRQGRPDGEKSADNLDLRGDNLPVLFDETEEEHFQDDTREYSIGSPGVVYVDPVQRILVEFLEQWRRQGQSELERVPKRPFIFPLDSSYRFPRGENEETLFRVLYEALALQTKVPIYVYNGDIIKKVSGYTGQLVNDLVEEQYLLRQLDRAGRRFAGQRVESYSIPDASGPRMANNVAGLRSAQKGRPSEDDGFIGFYPIAKGA